MDDNIPGDLSLSSLDISVLAHIAQYSNFVPVNFLKRLIDKNELRGDALAVAYAMLREIDSDFLINGEVPLSSVNYDSVRRCAENLLKWASS